MSEIKFKHSLFPKAHNLMDSHKILFFSCCFGGVLVRSSCRCALCKPHETVLRLVCVCLLGAYFTRFCYNTYMRSVDAWWFLVFRATIFVPITIIHIWLIYSVAEKRGEKRKRPPLAVWWWLLHMKMKKNGHVFSLIHGIREILVIWNKEIYLMVLHICVVWKHKDTLATASNIFIEQIRNKNVISEMIILTMSMRNHPQLKHFDSHINVNGSINRNSHSANGIKISLSGFKIVRQTKPNSTT